MLSNEAREKLDTGKFDFPVTERAIQTVGASTVVPFDVGRAIYRLDTNETIAIVGKNYKLLPHAPLYQTVNKELDNSYREFNNIDVIDQVFDRGALVKRTIVCKDEQYKVEIPTKHGTDFQ